MGSGNWQHAEGMHQVAPSNVAACRRQCINWPNQWSSRTCRASCQSSCPSGLGSRRGITWLKAMCTPWSTFRRLRVRCSLTSSCRDQRVKLEDVKSGGHNESGHGSYEGPLTSVR